jgi:hypothetical protein
MPSTVPAILARIPDSADFLDSSDVVVSALRNGAGAPLRLTMQSGIMSSALAFDSRGVNTAWSSKSRASVSET